MILFPELDSLISGSVSELANSDAWLLPRMDPADTYEQNEIAMAVIERFMMNVFVSKFIALL
jgi:hypothetical protein